MDEILPATFEAKYWNAVALGIDAECKKVELIVHHAPSLGVAREAILRNLIKQKTPAPFEVVTGFVFAPPAQLEPEPQFSRRCDLLIFDPSVSRPIYSIEAFSVVPSHACKFVIEVKSSLTQEDFKKLLDVWSSVAGFGVPTFGFAYDSKLTFKRLLEHLKKAAKDSRNRNEYSLRRLPECICIHAKNIIAFRRHMPDTPKHFMVVNFSAADKETTGAATAWFLMLYQSMLRRDADHDLPGIFNNFPLPSTAKAWIDPTGKIRYGNVPAEHDFEQ